MENLNGLASVGGESDEDDVLEIEIDFTRALYDYWKNQEKEKGKE